MGVSVRAVCLRYVLQSKNEEVERAVDDMIALIRSYPLDAELFRIDDEEVHMLKSHYNHFMYQVRRGRECVENWGRGGGGVERGQGAGDRRYRLGCCVGSGGLSQCTEAPAVFVPHLVAPESPVGRQFACLVHMLRAITPQECTFTLCMLHTRTCTLRA